MWDFWKENKFVDLAVAADGFSLYLVDETGTNLRLFTEENDEYVKNWIEK